MNLSLCTIVLLIMGLMPYTKSDQCFNNDGDALGLAGKQTNYWKGTDVIEFQRRGTEQCGCSYTEAKCMIVVNGQETTDCSDHVIDGIEAASTGSYPTVDVKYTVKICNYNKANAIALKKASGFQFYYPKVNENEETNIAIETLDNIIQPGKCIVKSGIQPISTSRASYYMKVFLEGPQQGVSTGAKIDNSYCYAYAFHVIDFKYDYGFGTCETSTRLDCKVIDEDGSQTEETCEDRILNMKVFQKFNATFTGRACNENGRDIAIQVGSSNFKYNTYEKKSNGKYKKEGIALPDVIPANTCKMFDHVKEVDAREKNFYHVKIQGNIYNSFAENNWVFKDRICEGFTFDELPMYMEPIIIPTFTPTKSAIPSYRPTSAPSVSNYPSTNPTSHPSTTTIPSFSPTAQPSSAPTVQPTLLPTVQPSFVPTAQPSSRPSNCVGGKAGCAKAPKTNKTRKTRKTKSFRKDVVSS